jgi:PAS domain S-box-containing protein
MARPTVEDLFSRVQALQARVEELQSDNANLRQSLSNAQQRLRDLVDTLPVGAVLVENNQSYLNRAAEQILGYTQDELSTPAAWFERLYPGRSLEYQRLYEADRAAGVPVVRVIPVAQKGGEERLVEYAGVWNADSEFWLLRDLTEPRRLARMLEQTARSSQVGGWELDVRTRKLYWTAETFRLHDTTPEGYTPEVETALQFYSPESIPIITEAVERGLTEGESHDLELELITAKQRRIWVRSRGVVESEEGRPVKLYGSVQDITRQKQADHALRLNEEQKRRLIAASPDCLLELDLDGRIHFANPRGRQMLGRHAAEPVAGRSWLDPWPAGSRAALAEAMEQARLGEEAQLQVVTTEQMDGGARWWDVRLAAIRDAAGRPERLLVSARDVTQLRLAEAEREEFQRNMLQTQKLESLGVLAGGIAHDFNNLLTGILGNAELVRYVTPPTSPAVGYVQQIDRAAQRAADLCRQMLAYAGKGRFVVEPVDVSGLVAETTQLLRLSAVSKKASLTVSPGAGLPPVLADATQLRQVLMNLVINASEALGEEEGLIAVSTGLHPAGDGQPPGALAGSYLPGGDYVYLEVSDTGCGMDQATQARIFEPFFTTKFTGRGLGLSAVLGIVRGHQGALTLRSTPGGGSTFRLFFPPTRRPIIIPRPSSYQGLAWDSGGVVLVVDDEEAVRRVSVELVRSFGFEVLEAQDGHEAVLLMKEHAARVRLVLLDLTMPRLDGAQTLEQLRQIDAEVRVILMSGYNQREVHERFVGKGLSAVLPKPFTRDLLGRRLREALGE